MKHLLLLLLMFNILFLKGQELVNKTWVKIKVERKDGSRVLDRLGTENSELRYFFKKNDTVFISTFYDRLKDNYKIVNNNLSIGSYQHFIIESVNDTSLILLEIPNELLEDDKINRYYFISENIYEDFLSKNNLMTLLNDSVLLSNNYVWPHFQGNIDIYFMDKMGNEFSRSYIIGSFIITPNGLLVDLNFNENKGLSKGATKKFIDILKNTSGYWDLPKLSKPFYYKINFTTRFINNGYKRSIGFRFNSDVPPCFENCAVSLSQLQKASNYFNKGTNLLIKGKLEKSIVQFTDCINIDSICIDAYYNRAAALYKLNNLDAACKDWRKLYELGQKEGERLFIQNCKK